MERIKHHFCWVKTAAGPRQPAGGAAGIGLADVLLAWSPGEAPDGLASDDARVGTAQPKHGGVPPPIEATSGDAVRRHGGVPPPQAMAATVARAQGGVPPPRALNRVVPALVPPPPPVEDAEASVHHGPVPPPRAKMIFAGASMAGAWAFDAMALPGASDDQGLRHEFQVVIGDRADAHDWLAGAEGQAWLADAKAVTLVTFAVVGVF